MHFNPADFRRLTSSICNAGTQLVYIDAAASSLLAEALSQRGIGCIVAWDENSPPLALPAMHFSHTFFSMLRNPTVIPSEAFAIAVHLTYAFGGHSAGPSAPSKPPLPRIRCLIAPSLPGSSTVPLPSGFEDVKNADNISAILNQRIPGYSNVRLCAPHAEVRLLLTALFGIMNATTLGHFCQALRAILVTAVRSLSLVSVHKIVDPQVLLPAGCHALRCKFATVDGAHSSVLMGVPENIVQQPRILEHVVRQTLAADAQALQMKLPPPGTPLPPVRNLDTVGGNAPLIEGLLVTSVWVVSLLRSMCQDPENRTLVAAGVGAVSGTPVASFTSTDGNRFTYVVTMNDPSRLLAQPPTVTDSMLIGAAMDPAVAEVSKDLAGNKMLSRLAGLSSGMGVLSNSRNFSEDNAPEPPSTAVPAPPLAGLLKRSKSSDEDASEGRKSAEGLASLSKPVEPWQSHRPPLISCNEEEFRNDLLNFLQQKQGRKFADPSAFPDITLQGEKLDLFNLYKSVVNAGGYSKCAISLDWGQQIFPALRNAQNGDVAGVESILKRHYRLLLLGYEEANAWRDMTNAKE